MRSLILLFSGMMLLLVSCSTSDPVDQACDILDKASEQVRKASTEDEARDIADKAASQLRSLNLDRKELSAQEQERLTESIVGFMQAAMSSKIDFTKPGSTTVLDLNTEKAEE